MNQPMWSVSDLAGYLGKPVSWVDDNQHEGSHTQLPRGPTTACLPHEIEGWLETKCRENAG